MRRLQRWSMVAGLTVLATATTSFRSQAQQQDPAPQVDRVGFPDGYETYYTKLFTFDRPDAGQIRVVYGNKSASLVKPGEPFPYGSVLVMETYRSRRDAAGNLVRDASGRFEPDALNAIFVMRKDRGFGAEYRQNRTGEWEYVAYRPDRTYNTAPSASAPCANCHLMATAGRDWVFRANLFSARGSGVLPDNVIQHYQFTPATTRIKVGVPFTWYNYDEIQHRIFLERDGLRSEVMDTGASYSVVFNQVGEYDYRCTIHPTMRGKVIVER